MVDTTVHNVKINPYIVGRSITEPKLFFGRTNLFQFIEDNLKQRAKVILLHGQRRIGKSSVLNQIPNFVDSHEFEFIFFDLHDRSSSPLSKVLYNLGEEIIDSLEIDEDKVKLPSVEELEANPNLFSENFLSVIENLLDNKNLVLLLDEFDVLSGHFPDSAAEKLFSYLKSIINDREKLFIIPVVGRHPDDMPKLLSLFKDAPHQRISLLDNLSAKDLIEKPAEGVLDYDSDAIQAILKLSAGHPYFTQVICHAIFAQARAEQNWKITSNKVEKIADKAIEISQGGLLWFRDGLPIAERVFFSAAAEVERKKTTSTFTLAEPLRLLEECGVEETESLREAGEYLVEWEFFQAIENSDLPTNGLPTYKITIELVKLWLLKQYDLKKEIWELEYLDSKAAVTYKEANEWFHQNALDLAIDRYEKTLAINPNHFRALFEMAEACLKAEDFEKGIELYRRALKVDLLKNKEGFLETSLSYSKHLVQPGNKADNLSKALELYAPAYQVDPIRTKQEFANALLIDKGIDWGNLPAWLGIVLSIVSAGFGSFYLSDVQNKEKIEYLMASVAPLEQEKKKLDFEIQDLKSKIAQAEADKDKLTDELEKARKELAKPIIIDISDLQRPYEFILNIKMEPREVKNIEMTLDKLILEKGIGMTLVFTTWNKHPQDSIDSRTSFDSRLTDNLGNEYYLIDSVGPRTINGGVKAQHELIFPLPKADAKILSFKISSEDKMSIFNLPPFLIALPEEVQSQLREN